jgi:tetratricopeptide (TPR) repeat protein
MIMWTSLSLLSLVSSFKPSVFLPTHQNNRIAATKLQSTTVVGQPSNGYYHFDMSDMPVSMGDADRAFRHGTNLEQQGLFRTAHAAYHETATLYQCFLDQDIKTHEFSHVTELKNVEGETSCRRYLAETCMRLAFLSMDALGDPRAAIRLYKEATKIDPNPNNIFAYDGIGTAIEASYPGNLKEAVRAYRKALEIEDNELTQFHLGVALERLGEESESIMDSLRRTDANYACLVDSWGYIR